MAANTSVLLLILGIIGMTQEYRHRTATPTFLTEPRRWRVIAAKLIAYALVAVPFALAIVAVTVLVAVVYAGARGAAPSLSTDNLQTLGASGLVLIVFAVIGVGLGALMRNQVGAIVGVAGLPLRDRADHLRDRRAAGRLQVAARRRRPEAITSDFQAPDLLEPWQGVLLLVGYGLLAALLGTLLRSGATSSDKGPRPPRRPPTGTGCPHGHAHDRPAPRPADRRRRRRRGPDRRPRPPAAC